MNHCKLEYKQFIKQPIDRVYHFFSMPENLEYITPPHKFIDKQIKGPYSLWKHTHTFIKEKEGTTIYDKIHYIVPLGIFGKIINLLWITKDLESIFTYRRKKIDQYFNTGNH